MVVQQLALSQPGIQSATAIANPFNAKTVISHFSFATKKAEKSLFQNPSAVIKVNDAIFKQLNLDVLPPAQLEVINTQAIKPFAWPN